MSDKIELRESEIADFLFEHPIKLGYSPTEDELDDLAAIVFDYFDSLGLIDEVWEEDDE